MKLSIIIPTRDSIHLDKVLESILKSKTNISYEIIVVDDKSEKKRVLSISKKIKYYYLDKKIGAAGARNYGAGKARGQVLLFLDSDVYLENDTISNLLSYIDDYDITYPKIVYESGKVMHPLFDFEKKYPHISACFAIKAKSFDKIKFDEKFETYLEDSDFFLRCRKEELPALFVDDAICTHAHKENKDFSKRYYLEVRNMMYGIRKHRYQSYHGVYNPFRCTSLIKLFFYGIFNFAWFNWEGYDRSDKSFFQLIAHKNKITSQFYVLPYLFLKGAIDGSRL